MSFAAAVEPRVDGGSCPHMAVVLRSGRELPAVLVSFYALGARRGGWVVHHAVPNECDRDRERLTAAGLDVGGLEAAGSLVLFEFDPAEAPEAAAERFEPLLADALERGHSALWYSRFPIGPGATEFARRDGLRPRVGRAFPRAPGDHPVSLCAGRRGRRRARRAPQRVARRRARRRGPRRPRGVTGPRACRSGGRLRHP